MIKGLYAAVSAMVTNANRQHVLSHNITNMDTPGFKQVLSTISEFQTTPVTQAANTIRGTSLYSIGSLGLGAQIGAENIDFSAGGLQLTGNPLDLAIHGEGFFTVSTGDGTRYTRDGRFLRDASGSLVTIEGYPVLDQAGQPIQLPDGQTSIAADGTISVDNETIAQLGLAVFANPETSLTRAQGNLYAASTQPSGDPAEVAQGYLEMSNANATQLMAALVEVGRSYEAAQQMVQNQDELLGKTISSLGRIA